MARRFQTLRLEDHLQSQSQHLVHLNVHGHVPHFRFGSGPCGTEPRTFLGYWLSHPTSKTGISTSGNLVPIIDHALLGLFDLDGQISQVQALWNRIAQLREQARV